MGDQCVNIAKLIPLTGHEPPVQEEILERVLRMGRAAREEVTSRGGRSPSATSSSPRRSSSRTARSTGLNREIFALAVSMGTDEDTREWAMTMTMAARAFERIGDNAVDIGEQTAFIVTGLFREFSDSSHPMPG
jgi:phosphate transport system protein